MLFQDSSNLSEILSTSTLLCENAICYVSNFSKIAAIQFGCFTSFSQLRAVNSLGIRGRAEAILLKVSAVSLGAGGAVMLNS